MKPQDNLQHDRETLSALLDGELPGEARLFAMRRLAHDREWQDDCGRWQMIGDAMRRQAPLAAPADFADRIRRDIDSSQAGAAVALASPTRRPARYWAGGAVAASLALLALFAVRGPREPVPAAVAAAPRQPAGAVAASDVAVQAPSVQPGAPPVVSSTDAVRLAVAERPAPRPAREARRAAPPASRSVDAPQPAIAAVLAPGAANPLNVPTADPLASRPWPRAALPGASGAFTASYGASGEALGDSPSFYPFEPRLDDAAGARNETP